MKTHEHDLPPQLSESRYGCRHCFRSGSDRLRFVRFEHCIRHRFQCSSIFCRRQRGRPRPSRVGIVNYVDHASLNQIVASVEERLDEVGKEKGVTFDYADYYANAQADQTNLNQIGADLVADGVDVIVAVATPTAATMLAAVEDTDIPVVYSAVTDPAAAGFDTEPNITGTSDALNTDAIMNLILAVNPDIDTIGLLYDLSQDASTQAIADAKAFCDSKGIKYIEKNGTTTAEVRDGR